MEREPNEKLFGIFFKNPDFSLKIHLYQVYKLYHPLAPCKKSDKTSDPIS